MRKRMDREGSYRQRPDGRWEGRLAFTDDDGVRRRLSFYGTSQAETKRKLDEAARRIDRNEPPKDSSITVTGWCSEWCEATLEASDRKPTTKALMRSLIRSHVATAKIGDVPLAKLRPSHFDAWLLELRRKTLSPATVQRVFRVLAVALDGAVRDDRLASNPARKVTQPTVERHDARVLGADEVRSILEAAQAMDADPRGHRSHNYPLFAVIAATGMRKGEALALRWTDIDFHAGTISVRGTLSRVNGKLIVTSPKTRASRRNLPVPDGLMRVMRAYRVGQLEDRMRAGSVWEDTGHVFTTASGAPRDPRGVLRSMAAAARRAGVEDMDVHTLRHSAATAMLDGGVHLKAVSTLLGHAGTQITADTYAHLTAPTAKRALDGLGAALGL